jgi:hypothetical protein
VCGLSILWVSGIALVWINFLENPEYITNQKLISKVLIVFLLTANGFVVHHWILPYLKERVGVLLFDDMHRGLIAGFSLAGSTSVVSWLFPLVLGEASELNYVTPAWLILALYLSSILVLWAASYSLINGLGRIRTWTASVLSSTSVNDVK